MNIFEMKETGYNEILDLDIIFPIINGKVSMAINRMLFRIFKREGLDITPEQWTVLSFLWKQDGVSQQKLCDATFKDKPSMTRLVDNLVKQDLVIRQTPPNDRRSNLIYLTEKGRSIQVKATKSVLETTKLALKGIDNEGINQVRDILKLVFDNIQEALGDK